MYVYNLISVHNKGLTIPHYSVIFTYWWQFGKWWIEIFDVVSPVTTLPQLLFNFMKNKIFLRFIFIRLSFFSLCGYNFPPKTWNKIHTFTGVLLQSTVQLIFLWNILPELSSSGPIPRPFQTQSIPTQSILLVKRVKNGNGADIKIIFAPPHPTHPTHPPWNFFWWKWILGHILRLFYSGDIGSILKR